MPLRTFMMLGALLAFSDGYRVPVEEKKLTGEESSETEPCLQPSASDLPKGGWCGDFQYKQTCFANEEHCWPVTPEEFDEVVSNALHTQPSQFSKRAIVLAGGMAAGKSSAFQHVMREMGMDPKEFVRSGFDDVMRALPQYKSHMKNRDQFAPMSNGSAQAGEKWDHMIGLMGSCRDVIRKAMKQIANEASKENKNIVAESFDGIAKIAEFAELCYDIDLVTVTNNEDEAVCRVLQRQDEEQRFKDIPGVRASYEKVKDDFKATRSMLVDLFSEKGFWNRFLEKHQKMCQGASFQFWNCDNTGKSMSCTKGGSMNEDWTKVLQAWNEYHKGEADSEESSKIVRPKTVSLAGFPDIKNGTSRSLFNGIYVEDVTGKCVQGRPTYWHPKVNKHTPFIYYCKSTDRWALALEEAQWEKVQSGECGNYGAFKAGVDLEPGENQMSFVYVGGIEEHLPQRRATGEEERDTWVKDIHIDVVGTAGGVERDPANDCTTSS